MKARTKPHPSFEQDVAAGTISAEDGQRAIDFIQTEGTLRKLSPKSINKYFFALRAMLREVHKRGLTVATLAERDAMALIQYVQGTPRWNDHTPVWSEDTREDYWKRWLTFYEWTHSREGQAWDPTVVRLFTDPKKRYRYVPDQNKVERKSTVTPEQVLRLLQVEDSLRWKAFFAVLYEGGLRAGETFSLRLGDVEKTNGSGYALHLSASKTEKRTIPLVSLSITYLEKWIRHHPRAGDQNALLFLTASSKPYEHTMCNKRLRILLSRAGIQKRKMSLHSFRHSRASELCNHMNEAQLCAFFGWAQGSRMPATYIRAEAIDVKKALLKAAGKEKEEEPQPVGRACLNCRTINATTAEYCDLCNLPLDTTRLTKIKQAEDTLNLVDNVLREKFADYDKKLAQLRAEYHLSQ